MASETHTDSFVEANKEYFNKVAHEYDELPHAAERGRRTAVAIRKAYNFDEESTTVMEYACGTGLVSRGLAQYTKRIVGIDISPGMVDQFNKRVEHQGLTPEEMQAFCVELKGQPGELDDEKFDVVVCAAAYHHFTSIDSVTRVLTYFLKPGGTLLVVDLQGDLAETQGGHGHGHRGHHHHHHCTPGHEHTHANEHGLLPEDIDKMVPHRGGLSEEEMRAAFEGAGLDSFSFKNAFDAKQRGAEVHLFIACGVKPSV